MHKVVSLLLIIALCVLAPFAAKAQQSQEGEASYYNDKYQGKKTASGELYDRNKYTAAHRTLPFGALVQVTNLKNNKAVIVKINDMGPFKEGRIVDLSYAAADAIGLVRMGVAPVKLDVLEEYPTASSPYAVGPVIGPQTTPNPSPPATTPAASVFPPASNQRLTPASAATAPAPTPRDDLVLPNIRPASSVPTTATTATNPNLRTSGSSGATQRTQGAGLYKFFAQEVTVTGYGVQVGAFSDYHNVLKATATLAARGVNDFLIYNYNQGGENVFKLIVGPFNSKGAAANFQLKLLEIKDMGKGMVINLANLTP